MRKIGKRIASKYFRPIDSKNVPPEGLSSSELENSLGNLAAGKKNEGLFLNRFNTDNIMAMLKEVGLIKHLDSLGFSNINIEIFKDEALINHLKIYDEQKTTDHLLIDLRLSESKFLPEKRFFENSKDHIPLDMVAIEWLSAQNPLHDFDPDRPQLPGQCKPGLGSLPYMMKIMYLVGQNLQKDGFLDIPDYFHGAVMYTSKFKFFNPAHEAVLKAMLRDLKDYSLSDLSWGVITKTIINKKTDEPQVYAPSEQIFPVSRFLKRYFRTRKYREKFNEIYNDRSYYFDYETMLKNREAILKEKKPEEI